MAGYILQPVFTRASDRALYQIVSHGARVVLIDRNIPGIRADAVMSDHYEGGRQVVRHLIDQGYQNIVYLAREPVQLQSIAERLRGYQNAMTESGLLPRAPFIVGGPIELGYVQDQKASTLHEKLVVEKITNFLCSPERPEAIVAMNDLVAMLVFEAAEQAGLKIPNDLSIVGFDDLDCACNMDLTTMAQRPFEIGSEAARLLLGRIRGNNEPAKQVLLPTQLVIRGSSINPR
jgi:LacI family transcriptional regulator